jgi:hypothetical protein
MDSSACYAFRKNRHFLDKRANLGLTILKGSSERTEQLEPSRSIDAAGDAARGRSGLRRRRQGDRSVH